MAEREFTPSVTVAAIVEHQGRYLFIEEHRGGRNVLNQPAGHWERGESLIEACRRECLEEAGCEVTPTHLVGIYHRHHEVDGRTYLRFAFAARLDAEHPGHRLDEGILRTWWLTPAELRARRHEIRTPSVLRCMEDHLAGERHPLAMLHDLGGDGG